MRKPFRATFGLILTFLVSLVTPLAHAVESVWEYSVQVSSSVQESPARVTLTWPQDTNGVPSSYTVYRKVPGATSWGTGTALPGSTTTYTDTSVTVGTAYEYRIVKVAGSYNGYGYIQTGIKAPLIESRGKLVLIVDKTIAGSLANELARLHEDLVGDGWSVVRHEVSRTDSPANVKNLIRSTYNADPANVKSVFLFGHVPVPYSGQFNPDGHPDHVGAWPADAYYGDMDGNWTDNSVNYTQTLNTDPADAARISNRPGDGKFDQTQLPSAIELEVGRVDLANLPGRVTWGGPATFPSEVELLRNYLNKDHNFRHRITTAPRRALVGDYFGARGGEAFAASGYRAFAPLVGASNVRNLNVEFSDKKGVWIPQASQNDYLLVYGCGAGSYSTIAGLGATGLYNDGSTTEMVSNNTHGVFNLLFGSWLGDWDHEDNILRAPLATSHGLVSVWSGRPHWFIHPLGLGQTIGSTTRLTQNNNGLYETQINSSANRIHVALMGDPTLRLHPVAPVSNLNGSASGANVSLTWSPSNDTGLAGYHVYRRIGGGAFSRLTSSPITATTFSDSSATADATYMVRAIKLENTTSGSYYNPSQGIFWSVGGATSNPVTVTPPPATATPTQPVVSINTEAVVAAPVPAVTTPTVVSSGQPSISVPTVAPAPGTSPVGPDGSVMWLDDSLPAGAGANGGDAWNWVTSNPAPFSGAKAHQTTNASGVHGHSFNWAAPFFINNGEILVAYVYLDPSSPPTEIMLCWGAKDWEHRAYWGSNNINYGSDNTPGRRHMGALPPTGQWVRLEVPASAVGLDGVAVQGMSFLAHNGRATFDHVGKALPAAPAIVLTPTVSVVATDANAAVGVESDTATLTFSRTGSTSAPMTVNFDLTGTAVKWVDYRRPEGDMPVTATIPAGANSTSMTIRAIANVTSANPPTAIVTLAENGTYAVGPQKTATITLAAAAPGTVTPPPVIVPPVIIPPVTTPPVTTTPPTTTSPSAEFVWADDSVPAGAGTGTSGGDVWNWVSSNPAPFSGTRAHQSTVAAGLHEHFFNWASPMTVATGDVLFTYVYLDPANLPSAIMLSWGADTWEHRAYWGADKINYGTRNTPGRYYAGPLPAAGQWVRLEVPASAVGLAGASVQAMCFTTFDGRVTFDKSGKGAATGGSTTPGTSTPPASTVTTVIVEATDATAVLGSASDTAQLTFKRAGSTTAPLLVKFALAGSAVKWVDYRRPEGDMPVEVTIPAGAESAQMTIRGIANVTNANPHTVTVTLSPDASYTLGTTKSAALTIAGVGTPPSSGGNVGSGGTTPPPSTDGGTTTPPSDGGTVTPPSSGGTTTPPAPSIAENTSFRQPQVGDHHLTVLSPTMVELRRITTKQPDPATVSDWNFVNSSGAFSAPAASQFAVTVNGQAVSVKSVGFKRRVAYAPLNVRDLRIDNSLFLELSSAIADNATVEVKNTGSLWPATMQFKSTAEPLRYSPAIHVNQEGYVPSFPKKAIVGYYLGNLGEMDISASAGFKIVSAATGVTVHQGALTVRRETGYVYSPQPYQKVLEADFTSFTVPGEYQLVVPGLGASLPFLINEGVAMAFARTYALGLYHQRCGVSNEMPYTRFVHDACHVAQAEIPSPQSSYAFTWTTIAQKNADAKSDPRHTAPQLKDEASQLYPFVNKGKVDVSLGHHDAGDYSKYTINSAALSHLLTFTADSIAGAGALDNLGLPESGDGISDILQEARQEATYISKLQDADGGFYFIVYPRNREYENNVDPGHGDQQVVWPKNTSATAASVAALAQIASSPKFKAAYPAEAAAFLAKAKQGWQFLMNAIARHGKDESYQKVTFYGQNYLHDDELSWAACELFLATGESQYHQKLKEWFPNPADSSTFRWGWWRLSDSYGNAIRSYAFAARSGRLSASQLDAAYLAKCEEQIKLAGDDAMKWSAQSAYGTALPEATRHVLSAGWYFSLDQASDMAVAYQLNPKAEYITALVGNMNYEAGTNPINITYVTGLGLKRQREIVHQWSNNSRQTLPMVGIPLGNVQSNFDFLSTYGASGNELAKLSFPTDANGTGMMTPFYDRWADTWNVTTEFISVNQARSLVSVAMLAGQTAAKGTAWKPNTTVNIVVPSSVAPVGEAVTVTLNASGLDLTHARIVWEGRDQEPDYGSTYSFTAKNPGEQWVEVEITWPDGRRVFGQNTFSANSAVITWVDDVVPAGAETWGGSEPWNWVSGSPSAYSGTKAHQTPAGSGLREHSFNNATSPLTVAAGDTLFAWVYLDPANMPETIMLHWNDGSWEHRAFWGANKIHYGTHGTAGRREMGALPAAGGWVKLEVPAEAVGLEGKNVKGMCFSALGGKVTWDAAGRSSPAK